MRASGQTGPGGRPSGCDITPHNKYLKARADLVQRDARDNRRTEPRTLPWTRYRHVLPADNDTLSHLRAQVRNAAGGCDAGDRRAVRQKDSQVWYGAGYYCARLKQCSEPAFGLVLAFCFFVTF